ncbi:hypothetical protein E2650_20350 [Shewanella xiamenensis]|uniref:Uncharacterized protein n=1 Tax=Shewanella xiamenensis TaxID=332186 RepID=A0AAW6R1Z0_9GAMM|nr:hypothetical protein [Shewanella xiamenensis]
MHVTSLGAAREIQEGIAVDPLLVGCGLKTHDFDSLRPLGRYDSHIHSDNIGNSNTKRRFNKPPIQLLTLLNNASTE